MKLKSIGVSVIGPAHIEDGLPNQDSLSLRGHKGGCLASVCDGLGSHKYSHHGSKIASQSVQKIFRSSSNKIHHSKDLNQMIHAHWSSNVEPQYLAQASTTCLFGHVLKNGDVTMGQLGDGLVLYKEGGSFHQLTPPSEAYGNQTNALQKTHIESNWHNTKCKLTLPGDGIILMSDGISDDLNPKSLPEFFNVIYELAATVSRRRAKKWLHRELSNWTTPKHSDDKTLVAIFRI